MRNSKPQSACEYEITWPGGEVYANSHGQTRLTFEEAKLTAPRIGGTWRRVAEAPGEGLDADPVVARILHNMDLLAGLEEDL